LRRIIRITDARIAAALATRSADDITAFLREVVSRWCDQNENVQDCARFLTALANLRVTVAACRAQDLNGATAANCFDLNIEIPDGSFVSPALLGFFLYAPFHCFLFSCR
jgi:hypothetical protein